MALELLRVQARRVLEWFDFEGFGVVGVGCCDLCARVGVAVRQCVRRALRCAQHNDVRGRAHAHAAHARTKNTGTHTINTARKGPTNVQKTEPLNAANAIWATMTAMRAGVRAMPSMAQYAK